MFPAAIQGVLDCMARIDDGSDDTLASESLIEEAIARGAKLKVESTPRTTFTLGAGVAGQDKPVTVVSTKKTVISLTIQLRSGPLRVRRMTTYLTQGPTVALLVGRPVLLKLNIDVERMLEELAGGDYDVGEMELESERPSGRPSRLCSLVRSYATAAEKTSLAPDLPPVFQSFPDDGDSIGLPIIDIGVDDPAEVTAALTQQVSNAKAEGMSDGGATQLKKLLFDYRDIWRIRLGHDPPVNVPPMTFKLKSDANPVISRARRYPPTHVLFMEGLTRELEEAKMIFKNPTSSWSSAPVVVPKPKKNTFRMTVDLRPVNAVTLSASWPMPHLDTVLERAVGASCFGSFDLPSGYWQLPLSEECREYHSFTTPQGTFTPTRCMTGGKTCVSFFQSSMEHILASDEMLPKKFLCWLDDCLACASSETELLTVYQHFFAACRLFGLKLHAVKSKLFALSARWCGRVIDGDGVTYDPSKINSMLEIPEPTRGCDLQQYVHALNWMRSSLPNYAEVVAPLQACLLRVTRAAGSATKRAASRILLADVGWGEAESAAFADTKRLLHHAMKLAHPREDRQMCLFSDASDGFYAAFVTQVPHEDLDLPLAEQRHEPLACLSGAFTGAASRWSIVEKEAFAIVEACDRFEYLLLRPDGFIIRCDHANLAYIFDPVGRNPAIARHAAAKLLRWALRLAFTYVIEPLPGSENLWTDLMTRWGVPVLHRSATSRILSAAFAAPVSPLGQDDFCWPTLSELKKLQDRTQSKLSSAEFTQLCEDLGLELDTDGLLVKSGEGERPCWVPDSDALQLRICIAAHCGPAGHRGFETTFSQLKSTFFWPTMKTDFREFHDTCLHCLLTKTGARVPRPLAEALHAETVREVLHFDFLSMPLSSDGVKYILVLKDDLSGYVWLWPCPAASAECAAQGIIALSSAFGVFPWWVSDQGSHLKNATIASVQKSLGSHHHFTTAYSPWANGTVEVLNREALKAFRVLLSEFVLQEEEWTDLLPMVQSLLNHTPTARLNGKSPIEVFCGQPRDSPLLSFRHSVSVSVSAGGECSGQPQHSLLPICHMEALATTHALAVHADPDGFEPIDWSALARAPLHKWPLPALDVLGHAHEHPGALLAAEGAMRGVNVKQSRVPGGGLGLFASRSFKEGDIVGAYFGALVGNTPYRSTDYT